MKRSLSTFIFSLLILAGCIKSKGETYNTALLRVKGFLAFSDSIEKSTTSIHQLQYFYAQARESLETRLIPYLDSICQFLDKAQMKKINTLRAYLELYFKEPKTAEDFSKLEEMRKEVENILKEAKAK